MQPPAITCVVVSEEKSSQWHFYCQDTLRKRCEDVFKRQGTSTSEGFKRLITMLVEAPESLQILMLRQAYGEAAVALARDVLFRLNSPAHAEFTGLEEANQPAAQGPAAQRPDVPAADAKVKRAGKSK